MRMNEEKRRNPEKGDGAGAGRKNGVEVVAGNEQSAAAAGGSVGGAVRGGVGAGIGGGAEVESGGKGEVDPQIVRRYPFPLR